MKVVFKSKEELINFLNWCNLKDFEVMFCPRCSVVFYREATSELENTNTEHLKKFSRRDQ